MRLEELRPLQILEFNESHDCLCGCRTIMSGYEGDDDEDDLFVVCENGEAHPLSDLCDDDGLLEDGIEIAADQPTFLEGFDPQSPEVQARVLAELQVIMNDNTNPEYIPKYMREALFNLTMLRYCLPEHEREAMVEHLINAAYQLATYDQVH